MPSGEGKRQAIKVEELVSFPFTTFQEFRDACRDGLCYVRIDRSAALSWVQSGKYSTVISGLFVTALTLAPFLAVLGFVVYSILCKCWFLLLALPVFVIAYLLFHPSMQFAGTVRSVPIWLSVLGFVWGVLSEWPSLMAITGALLLIWLSQLAADKHSRRRLTQAVTDHEDLLCIAWRNRVLGIQFADGRFMLPEQPK
jgi:hypothetical protein